MNHFYPRLGWRGSVLARLVCWSPGGGQAGQHVPEPAPELRGEEGVQDGVDAGVAVGQHVGTDLSTERGDKGDGIGSYFYLIFHIIVF